MSVCSVSVTLWMCLETTLWLGDLNFSPVWHSELFSRQCGLHRLFLLFPVALQALLVFFHIFTSVCKFWVDLANMNEEGTRYVDNSELQCIWYLWSSRCFQYSQKEKKQVWVFFFPCYGVKGVTSSHISKIFFIIKWIGNFFFIINNYIFLGHISPGAYMEEKYIYCKPMIKLWKHQ